MATTDLPTAAAKTADAVVDTATAAPKAVAAVVEAAPVVAAAVIETVANALPKAKRAAPKAKRAAPKAKRTAAKAKLARKPTAKTAAAAKRATKPAARLVKAVKTTAKTTAAKAAPIMKGKTMTDTVKTMTAQGEKIVAELKTRTEGAVAKSKVMFTELNDFNKGNVDAIVESGKIAAKGFEKLGQDAAEYTRKSFEQTTSAFKGMAAIKSPTELMKLHSDYVRSSFDAMVAQTSHSTEAFLKLAGEIAQPISNRFAVAAEKVKLAA